MAVFVNARLRFRHFGDACIGTRHPSRDPRGRSEGWRPASRNFGRSRRFFYLGHAAEWPLGIWGVSAVKSSRFCTHTCVFAELGLSYFYHFGAPKPIKPFMALTLRHFGDACNGTRLPMKTKLPVDGGSPERSKPAFTTSPAI
jgi:hypothetical protein